MKLKNHIAPFLTVLSLLLAGQANALDLGGLAKSFGKKAATDTAIVKTADAISGDSSNDAVAADSTAPQSLESAAPVVSAPLAVSLEARRGSASLFAKRPKVAVAGYNIGAYQTASISGTTTRGQGAKVSMSMTLTGVDEAMLQRVADAAHADLIAQLQAAGIDVIHGPALFSVPEAQEIKRATKPVKGDKMDGRAPKELLVVGPADIGVVSSFGLIPVGFNGNIGDQASDALDAIIIYPNVALDFVWTAGGGRSMLQNKVSVDGGARFALDSLSNMFAVYSKDGRFVDDSVLLGLTEDIGVDDAFATVDQAGKTNNNVSVGISNALGVGMGSRKGTQYVVDADPARYEALALNATKGMNAALLEQIKAAKGIQN